MRRTLFAVVLLAAALVAPGRAGPAAASSTGPCTTSAGVTVVVDFSAFGGGVETRCMSSATSKTYGAQALTGAGFSAEGAGSYGLSFICRINSLPSKADESCATTPPTTAYWSYWYASNGGSWTYSSKGAMGRTVIVGGFEGWSFHKGSASATPPAAAPTRPTEVPTVKLGPAASTTGSSKHTSSSSTSSHPSTAKPTARTTSPTTSPTPSATTTDGTSTATSTSGDLAGGALPGDPPGGSSPWPLVGTGVGIVLVGGGAALVALRRRGTGGF